MRKWISWFVAHNSIITTREIRDLKIQDGHKLKQQTYVWWLGWYSTAPNVCDRGSEGILWTRQRGGSSEKVSKQSKISVFARSSSRRRKVSCTWRPTYGPSSKLAQSSNSIDSQFLEVTVGKFHSAIPCKKDIG